MCNTYPTLRLLRVLLCPPSIQCMRGHTNICIIHIIYKTHKYIVQIIYCNSIRFNNIIFNYFLTCFIATIRYVWLYFLFHN